MNTTIAIQFMDDLSVAFVVNDQGKVVTKLIQEARNFSLELEAFLHENSLQKKKCNVICTVPYYHVGCETLKSIPNDKKLKKKQDFLQMEAEQLTKKTSSEFLFSTDVDEEKIRDEEVGFMIAHIKHKDVEKFAKVIHEFKNLQLCDIVLEPYALRRHIPEKNIVILHYFKDEYRHKEMVGVYIFKDQFLLGIRHMYVELYPPEGIYEEVQRMTSYCKTTYRNYKTEKIYAFGQKTHIEELQKVFSLAVHELQSEPFAVGKGLLLFKRKGDAKISLLPKAYVPEQPNYLMIAFILIYLLSGGFLLFENIYKNRMIAQTQSLMEDQQGRIQLQQKLLQEIQKEVTEDELYTILKDEQEQIKTPNIRKGISYSAFLVLLGEWTNAGVKVDAVQSAEQTITIKGQSMDYRALMKFQNIIKESGIFSKIYFAKIEKKPMDEIIEYELLCEIE